MAETTKYTIPPLKWKLKGRAWTAHVAGMDMHFIVYPYSVHHEGEWRLAINDGDPRVVDSPEHGKALAEDYWQSYMKQGLIPVKEGEA